MSNNTITVGELKNQLKGLRDTDKLHLPGGLSFYRLKRWGDNEFIIEVNEPTASLSEKFKKRNPNVKVAFIGLENIRRDEDETLSGSINVEVL